MPAFTLDRKGPRSAGSPVCGRGCAGFPTAPQTRLLHSSPSTAGSKLDLDLPLVTWGDRSRRPGGREAARGRSSSASSDFPCTGRRGASSHSAPSASLPSLLAGSVGSWNPDSSSVAVSALPLPATPRGCAVSAGAEFRPGPGSAAANDSLQR